MPPLPALALLPLLFWDAWRLLAGRLGDGLGPLPLLFVAAAASVPAFLAIRKGAADPVPPGFLAALLAPYALALLAGPPLFVAAAAVTGFLLLCRRVGGGRLPAAPLAGLGLLALPVLPSLDFYFAYPMRRLCAEITAFLLRLNGLPVAVEGVGLRWNGDVLLFDAACSGIRMVWTCAFLVSFLALAAGSRPRVYARGLTIALAGAILGNSIRAASLFYVENGFVPQLHGPVAHEVVGMASFMLLAGLVVALVAPRQRRLA